MGMGKGKTRRARSTGGRPGLLDDGDSARIVSSLIKSLRNVKLSEAECAELLGEVGSLQPAIFRTRTQILNTPTKHVDEASAQMSEEQRRVFLGYAKKFAKKFAAEKHSAFEGGADGKTIGTYIEKEFKNFLLGKKFLEENQLGSSAAGIDLPTISTDIKSTNARQPQSSSPFETQRQKIDGLGHNLLLFVYNKDEEDREHVSFEGVYFIPSAFTGDRATTEEVRAMLEAQAPREELIQYLQKNGFADTPEAADEYAASLEENIPEVGAIALCNALQWRVGYRKNIQDNTDVTRVV